MKQNIKALEETMSKIRRCEPEVLQCSCTADRIPLSKFKNSNLSITNVAVGCPVLFSRSSRSHGQVLSSSCYVVVKDQTVIKNLPELVRLHCWGRLYWWDSVYILARLTRIKACNNLSQ